MFAIVFSLEYEVGLTTQPLEKFDPKEGIRKSLQGELKPISSTFVTIGCAAYIPSDGKILFLKNISSLNNADIQLSLTRSEICSTITDTPLIEMSDNSHHLAASFAVESKAKEKNEMSNNSSTHVEEKFDDEFAVISFNLRLLHPIRGQLEDRNDVADLLSIVDGKDRILSSADHSTRHEQTAKFFEDKASPLRRRKEEKPVHTTLKEEVDYQSDSESAKSGSSHFEVDGLYYNEKSGIKIKKNATDDQIFRNIEAPRDEVEWLPKSKSKSNLARNLFQARFASSSDPSTQLNEKAIPFDKNPFRTIDNNLNTRELSRAAKSKINRFGIDCINDSSKVFTSDAVENFDVEKEIYDKNSIHEISIQFVGYRSSSERTPRAIYFSFKFFSCPPIRTENLRVVTSKGEDDFHILLRDSEEMKSEPAITIRFTIDCSKVSVGYEFSRYLASKSLHVDVWDSDSLLPIGFCVVPLKKLLRHGKVRVKEGIECDIVDNETYWSNDGVGCIYISSNGSAVGEVVGRLSLVIGNCGSPGKQPQTEDRIVIPVDGLNWRTSEHLEKEKNFRPKHTVFARPLSNLAPDLSVAIKELKSKIEAPSIRSMNHEGKEMHSSVLNYDEVVILYKLFQGTTKGCVQYAGDLLRLLDIPSYKVAIRKIYQIYKRIGGYSAFQKVGRLI
jgi:hypothetical protein